MPKPVILRKISDFLCKLSYSFIPTIDKQTRVSTSSATLIDNIFASQFGREIKVVTSYQIQAITVLNFALLNLFR